MYLVKPRKIAAKTPVYDHADEVLYYAPREKVLELIARPGVQIIGTTRRIRALRYVGPDPALSLLNGSDRRPGIEKPHRRETYYNPAGVLTFNFLSVKLKPEFNRVVESVTVRRTLHQTLHVVEMPQSPVQELPKAA